MNPYTVMVRGLMSMDLGDRVSVMHAAAVLADDRKTATEADHQAAVGTTAEDVVGVGDQRTRRI